MRLIFVTSVVLLTGAFANCTSPEIPAECQVFDCKSLAKTLECKADCFRGSKMWSNCTAILSSLAGCGSMRWTPSPTALRGLSWAGFACDTYLAGRALWVHVWSAIGQNVS